MIEDHIEDPALDLEDRPASGSLEERMAQRAEQLARRTTSRFPLPGWEDMLEVELRASGVREATKVTERLQRQRDPGLRNLYTMADLILLATVRFYEVDGERVQPIDDTWVTLAQRLENCPDNPTPRQALLFLLTDRVPYLIHEWELWQRSVRPEEDEDLRQDFGRTG